VGEAASGQTSPVFRAAQSDRCWMNFGRPFSSRDENLSLANAQAAIQTDQINKIRHQRTRGRAPAKSPLFVELRLSLWRKFPLKPI